MKISKVLGDKKKYIKLLLLADEQVSQIDKYLGRSTMYILEDGGKVIAECVVTDEGNGVLEIKNLAVNPHFQKKGYGKSLIKFIEEKYKNSYKTLRVGTGDSPLTLPFYKKCGFAESGRIKNFFLDYYDHEIIECGVKLCDMVILEKSI